MLLETSVISLAFSLLLFLPLFPERVRLMLYSHFVLSFWVFDDDVQPTTPLEHCEWLNKLLIEVWPNYISPRLSLRFSSIVEVNYFVLYLSISVRCLRFAQQAAGSYVIVDVDGSHGTSG